MDQLLSENYRPQKRNSPDHQEGHARFCNILGKTKFLKLVLQREGLKNYRGREQMKPKSSCRNQEFTEPKFGFSFTLAHFQAFRFLFQYLVLEILDFLANQKVQM